MNMSVTVGDIYSFIDELAPFTLQEGYDNSGLCVGNMDRPVTRVLTALDCTREVAREAIDQGAELIVTHHPVIFRGIKHLDLNSVVGKLAAGAVNVISAHTSFDSAKLNYILCETLGLEVTGPLAVHNGAEMGLICSTRPMLAPELAEHLRKALGCQVVRYADSGSPLRRIAVCSGRGGSLLEEVLERGCDGFITGDVKHDVFIDAHNAGLTVFDAGHFHTEVIFSQWMAKALGERFPELAVSRADMDRDILSYAASH